MPSFASRHWDCGTTESLSVLMDDRSTITLFMVSKEFRVDTMYKLMFRTEQGPDGLVVLDRLYRGCMNCLTISSYNCRRI